MLSSQLSPTWRDVGVPCTAVRASLPSTQGHAPCQPLAQPELAPMVAVSPVNETAFFSCSPVAVMRQPSFAQKNSTNSA